MALHLQKVDKFIFPLLRHVIKPRNLSNEDDIDFFTAICEKCGTPKDMDDPFCVGDSWDFNFDKIRSLYFFDDALKPYLHLLKYKQYYITGRYFGRQLAKHIDKEYFKNIDYIIPIPLHHTRYRERGYNQSLMICEGINHKLYNIPILHKAVKRVKKTSTQTQLTRSERQKNISGIFKIGDRFARDLSGKNILLVDDVFTTGATVNELAKALKAAGIKQVDIWVCSRA